MMWKYVRKTKNVDPQNLIRALYTVQSGMSIRTAARDFGANEKSICLELAKNQCFVSQSTAEEIEMPVFEEGKDEAVSSWW